MPIPLNTTEEIISDIRAGKMVILMDDENRENEGDLIVAAETITADMINFMASKARGLICLTLTEEHCRQLGLKPMVEDNGARHSTPFMVSIEAATGVSTGISAADRARTIQVAVDPHSTALDLVQPGHIFPLRAQPGGVLSRAGHTEAGCDLARLAGLIPAAVIVEIMNDDGTMARAPQLEQFAQAHQLRMGSIADLIHYRILHEHTIELLSEHRVLTPHGEFTLSVFTDSIEQGQHIALTLGQLDPEQPTLVRVHSAQTLRDLVQAKSDHQGWTLHSALAYVAAQGCGAVVLLDIHKGRDLLTELTHYHDGPSSVQPPEPAATRIYTTIGTGSQIIRHLGIRKMRLLSSPMKFGGISGFGLQVVDYIEHP